MRFVLIAATVPLYIVAIVAIAATKSDIQVIIAVLGFGFASLTLGLSALLARVSELLEYLKTANAVR